MPKYRMYVPVIADDVYEVVADSKEAARQMYDDGLNWEHWKHTTPTAYIDPTSVYNPTIKVEEID